MTTMTAPPKRSFSQLQTILRCARQYYLGKIAKVPEKPSMYLVGGNAVHEHIENLNHLIYQKGRRSAEQA